MTDREIKPSVREYPCPLSPTGSCKHGGNKYFNNGFGSGTDSYCRLVKKWVVSLEKCPLATQPKER